MVAMNGDWPHKFDSFLPKTANGGGQFAQCMLGLAFTVFGVTVGLTTGGVAPWLISVAGALTAAFPTYAWLRRRRQRRR